jgi:PEP-CTERM motif
MRKIVLATAVMAAFTLFAASGFASPAIITIGSSTQTCTSGDHSGCIAITYNGSSSFTVTFPTTLSGNTTPSGGYSFNSVGPLTFTGGDATTGSSFNSGTAGTLTLGGNTVALTWTLLDGDGGGYDMFFRTPLSSDLDEIFLNPPNGTGGGGGPVNFSQLFGSAAGTTAYTSISGGEAVVPEPISMLLLGTGLLGLGFLRRTFGSNA